VTAWGLTETGKTVRKGERSAHRRSVIAALELKMWTSCSSYASIFLFMRSIQGPSTRSNAATSNTIHRRTDGHTEDTEIEILKPATHVTETGTSHLVPETCTCVGQSGTRFFCYQILFHHRNCEARDTNRAT